MNNHDTEVSFNGKEISTELTVVCLAIQLFSAKGIKGLVYYFLSTI